MLKGPSCKMGADFHLYRDEGRFVLVHLIGRSTSLLMYHILNKEVELRPKLAVPLTPQHPDADHLYTSCESCWATSAAMVGIEPTHPRAAAYGYLQESYRPEVWGQSLRGDIVVRQHSVGERAILRCG